MSDAARHPDTGHHRIEVELIGGPHDGARKPRTALDEYIDEPAQQLPQQPTGSDTTADAPLVDRYRLDQTCLDDKTGKLITDVARYVYVPPIPA